jgi:hypothetical protein
MSPKQAKSRRKRPAKLLAVSEPEADAVRTVPPPPTIPLSVLRLHSFSGSIISPKEISAEPKQANTQLKLKSNADPETRKLSFAITFRVEAIHPGETSIGFVITAEYRLQWGIPEQFPWPQNEEDVEGIGQQLVIRVVWPFWREMVLNATGRFGVPPLILPLVFAPPTQEKQIGPVKYTKEWAEKSQVIEQIKLHFEHDPAALNRGNRISKMYALMTVGELNDLLSALDSVRRDKKVKTIVDAIIAAREAKGDIGRQIYDALT